VPLLVVAILAIDSILTDGSGAFLDAAANICSNTLLHL
jgi:hypothetical protein